MSVENNGEGAGREVLFATPHTPPEINMKNWETPFS